MTGAAGVVGTAVGAGVSSDTGQTVVPMTMISVVTLMELAGQSVTVGAHDVTVWMLVE